MLCPWASYDNSITFGLNWSKKLLLIYRLSVNTRVYNNIISESLYSEIDHKESMLCIVSHYYFDTHVYCKPFW